ncbi:MAG: ATPase, T2SS/T4P/T4SS family [Candidatus Binatia bacterium]
MSTAERAAGDRALLRFLARQGRVSAEDVTRVETLLEAEGAILHDVLEREGIIGQKDLALMLAETLRLRIVDLTTYPLDANVTRELKENIAARYEVVPISIDERTIEVVTANPLDLEGLKAVEFATGKRVQPVVATHVEVKDALKHTYRLQESLEQFLQLVPAGESLVVNELNDEGGDLRTIAADAELPPVIKLADKMLIEGIKSRASDIHVEPETDSVLVRYRVDGILEEAFRFPKWIQNPLVARLKVMAKLDITERRLPQDGRIQVRYSDKSVDMRVSSLPAQHGEKITLRILDASQGVKILDRLGLSPNDLKLLRDAAKKPQGMILITGPTGSGKTTTLYALLREIFSPKTNIVTIENPIEYQLKGINQVEVNEKQGLTFGGVLRSVLRQDPDVILLGEIRDKETAQIAFQAATTGHLVLSTVHTNDAAGAVTRLIDLGLEPYAIASAMNLVVAQRLVRQLCPTCSKPTELDPEMQRQLHADPVGATFKENVGCAQCRHTGYRSRLGVYEMLPMTTAMAKLVEAGAGESMVRQQARSEGLHTLLEDAVDKLRTGLTTVEELQRVVQIGDSAGTQCPGCKKEIAEDYSVCPHCSKTLRSTCSGCAKPLNPEWVRCPYCGSAATVDETPAAAETPASRRSFKALVVDDTSTIRDVVQHTLEHSDLGLTVLTAEDGPTALEIASRERPDIVILDISMPGMDGFEVCRRLRSEMRTAFVPVLMLTAHDSEDDVARGFGVGADDYMVKPFRREGLITRVKRILERTYGSQAVGTALPDTGPSAMAPMTPPMIPAAVAAPAFTAPAATSPDVTAALAELAADRDALRRAVASCETRLGELALQPAPESGNGCPHAATDSGALDDLKNLIAEMRAMQDRSLDDLRAEMQRTAGLAREALQSANATTTALPPEQFASMLATVEHLQGEQARMASAVEAVGTNDTAVDEECERRLRQATQAIDELRTGIDTLRAGWQRDATAIRAEVRAACEDAWQRAQTDASAADARLVASLEDLRSEIAGDRDARTREGARLRGAEEQANRAQAETLAVAEKTARELAAVQRTLAEQQTDRQQDAERMAGAEESARRARAEMLAVAEQMSAELVTLRRTLAEQRDGGLQVGARVAGSEDALQQMRSELTSTVGRLSDELTGITRDLERHQAERVADGVRAARERTEMERLVALQAETRGEGAGVSAETLLRMQQEAIAAAQETARTMQHDLLATVDASARAAQRDMLAAAEAGVQAAHQEAMAANERTAHELAALAQTVSAQHGAQQQEVQELRHRLDRGRRAAVKLVQRVRAGGAAVAARVEAREAECEEHVASIRDETATMLGKLRDEQAAVTADVNERLIDLPSAAEHRSVMAFLDGCETQLTEFAARLDAQGTVRAASDEASRQQLVVDVLEVKSVVARIDGEQRRLAADVEERLRSLMRTAAGGFDVQLALLRGKVEVLARTLRDRVPVDPAAPTDEGLLAHRHGLLDQLRQQLTALQSATEWNPRAVLDLLVDSTLAAAITPFRRILKPAESEPAADRGAEKPAENGAGASATDESTSPS